MQVFLPDIKAQWNFLPESKNNVYLMMKIYQLLFLWVQTEVSLQRTINVSLLIPSKQSLVMALHSGGVYV